MRGEAKGTEKAPSGKRVIKRSPYGRTMKQDRGLGRVSEFGDMRNFSDEQFLLFFANQYPEAFNEVAGEFHEFGRQGSRDLPNVHGVKPRKSGPKHGSRDLPKYSEFGDHEFVRQAASEDWNPPGRGNRSNQPMSTREYKSSGKPRQGRKLKIKLQPGGTVSQADHDRMRWKYNTSEFSDLHEFDCKRRLAKGREMLKFMEGYCA